MAFNSNRLKSKIKKLDSIKQLPFDKPGDQKALKKMILQGSGLSK